MGVGAGAGTERVCQGQHRHLVAFGVQRSAHQTVPASPVHAPRTSRHPPAAPCSAPLQPPLPTPTWRRCPASRACMSCQTRRLSRQGGGLSLLTVLTPRQKAAHCRLPSRQFLIRRGWRRTRLWPCHTRACCPPCSPSVRPWVRACAGPLAIPMLQRVPPTPPLPPLQPLFVSRCLFLVVALQDCNEDGDVYAQQAVALPGSRALTLPQVRDRLARSTWSWPVVARTRGGGGGGGGGQTVGIRRLGLRLLAPPPAHGPPRMTGCRFLR